MMRNSKNSNEVTISFPSLQSWNPETKTATIAAQVNGQRVLCRIPMTVLKKAFKCTESEDPMLLVTNYRREIEAAARKLIENKAYEDNGSININYEDL